MPSSLTKTGNQTLLALQSVAAGAVAIGSDVDVSTALAAGVYIHFGRRAATALTVACQIRIEATPKASGDGFWFPLFQHGTAIAAASDEAVSGTVSAGTNVITVASTTGLVAGDVIYIDNGTIANSEWGRIKSIVANTSVTIEDNLLNAQTGATLYDQAEIVNGHFDLSGILRLRAVVDNTGTGQNVAVEVFLVTADSIG